MLKGKVGRAGASISHAQKASFKFAFDVLVERVEKVNSRAYAGVPLFVVVQKREHVYATSGVMCAAKVSDVNYNESVRVELTLFSDANAPVSAASAPGAVNARPSDKLFSPRSAAGATASAPSGPASFMEKDIKVALRSHEAAGKTIGKIHVDASKWARVPSGCVTEALTLSNGSVVSLKITSRLLDSAKPGVNIQGKLPGAFSSANSAGSSAWGRVKSKRGATKSGAGDSSSSIQSGTSIADDDEWLNELEDMDDLLDDASAEFTMTAREEKVLPKQGPRALNASGATDKSASVSESTDDVAMRDAEKRLHALQAENEHIVAETKEIENETEELERAARALERELALTDLDNEEGGVHLAIEDLQNQLRQIVDENETLEKNIYEVEKELEELELNEDSSASVKRYGTANVEEVKRDIQRLSHQLERDSQFLRLIEELKTSKLAYVVALSEYEEACQALRLRH
ncbi:hypothetical protein FVE85_8698 [Porphyridium purpureum]|uniref:C2 NT-type domain-containing protein n=1 Tax=Porphyridium purpureum TaxID=35688 RepID=A0A5J4YR36_PORPP|nr:hypothetical protein FVE85_8698 [Porphyridium purpureum]|eukprot:POR4119..scf296_7